LIGNPYPMPTVNGQTLSSNIGMEYEVKEIAKKLNTNALIGSNATIDKLNESIRESPLILHFATHGLYEEEEFTATKLPGSLALSNYLLTSNEVIKWKLNGTELVVLSACDTGKGQINADGIFGLSRVFLIAGAKVVIVSLWPVSDSSTKILMVKFYDNMIEMAKGVSINVSRAFQEVMIWMKGRREHRSPLEWSPFIVIG
jgi:CHAT domain-containing protein